MRVCLSVKYMKKEATVFDLLVLNTDSIIAEKVSFMAMSLIYCIYPLPSIPRNLLPLSQRALIQLNNLSLSIPYTHTHTHTQKERGREREL